MLYMLVDSLMQKKGKCESTEKKIEKLSWVPAGLKFGLALHLAQSLGRWWKGWPLKTHSFCQWMWE